MGWKSFATLAVGFLLSGCNSTSTQSVPKNNPNAAAEVPTTQTEKTPNILELERGPIDGFVEQSETNPSTLILYSKYRGNLYLVSATVTKLDIHQRTYLEAQTEAKFFPLWDYVLFQVVAGQSIPSHPGYQFLRNHFNVNNVYLKFNYRIGRKFEVAFTDSGTFVAFWPADLPIVPGMWNEGWEDPNRANVFDPPTFKLIPPRAE